MSEYCKIEKTKMPEWKTEPTAEALKCALEYIYLVTVKHTAKHYVATKDAYGSDVLIPTGSRLHDLDWDYIKHLCEQLGLEFSFPVNESRGER